MAGRRADLALTTEELEELVDNGKEMVLASVNDAGWPVATVARRATLDHRRLVVSVPLGANDGPLLENGSRLCCVVEESSSYDTIKGAALHGVVTSHGASGTVELDVERVISFDFAKVSRT